ncbi:hypothetical protein Ancab_029678 [Ancistrocladus abbreviatus]
MSRTRELPLLFCFTVFTLVPPCHHPITFAAAAPIGGGWQLLQKSIGISAMHMQLLYDDRVVIFDRTDFGKSNLSFPPGQCPNVTTIPSDCTAHSAEYNVATNTYRPLVVHTDTWCSSGALAPDGRLIQTGGFADGERVVRIFKPCDTCDWQETGPVLLAPRWYATNHFLPDGRMIIIGGRGQFNYEYYPKSTLFDFPFLAQTSDPNAENNLYPFVFLHIDGHLFVFANNRAILYDYTKRVVVQTYPTIPGGDPRCYPSTGSAVLLPLNLNVAGPIAVEVLVCGGAPSGSFRKATRGKFVGALNTCARIKITDSNPQWSMETMPLARVMGDMLLLPNGNVIIIKGAAKGVAGWELGRDPVLNPVIYKPHNRTRSRFEVENPSTIPRMYHSTAILLRDGRILVGGSNPHDKYMFSGVLYPTELSLEAYLPSYLDSSVSRIRPIITSPASQSKIAYGKSITIGFTIVGRTKLSTIKVTMIAPPFNTHSFSQSQRLLVLKRANTLKRISKSEYELQVTTPSSLNLAPPGYYLLFVVHQDVPSEGIWVQIG